MDVVRLLTDCLQDVRGTPVQVAEAVTPDERVDGLSDGLSYAATRRRFLAGGLSAVREGSHSGEWVQLHVQVADHAWPRLYSQLASAARELLGSGAAGDFFFMHKPPGLRVRFRAQTPECAQRLRTQATALLDPADCGEPGVAGWSRPVAGVYEPETYLFGGPASMEHVHRLFTADSLAWLDSLPDEHAAGDWRVSLVLLRAVLDGLGIVGWEHRGVWQVVRDEAGRRLSGDLGDLDPQLRRAAAGIRGYWRLPADAQLDVFPAARREQLVERRDALRSAAQGWRTGYFESGHAEIGPRRAAAHFVVFHWNRGRFTAARQRLLTEALVAAEAE